MVQEGLSHQAIRGLLAGLVGASFIALPLALILWFAMSSLPDLWVVLNAWLQPE